MWLLWVCFLFVPSSAFPFGNPSQHYHGLLEIGEWPFLNSFQRPSFCVPSPFIGRLCFPSISRLLSPMKTLEVKKQGCATIPLTPEYVVKLCTSNETKQERDNIKEPQKEMIREREEGKKEEEEEEEEEPEPEPQPEPFSDNATVQVNREEDEAEKFAEKEGKDKSQWQLEQGEEDDVRNKIIQVSEEIVRLDNGNISPEPIPLVRDEDDENVSIMSNLV